MYIGVQASTRSKNPEEVASFPRTFGTYKSVYTVSREDWYMFRNKNIELKIQRGGNNKEMDDDTKY